MLTGYTRTFNDELHTQQESVTSFFAERVMSGQVRDDLNSAFTVVTLSSASLSVVALQSGNVPAYEVLQGVSLVSGVGSFITDPNLTSLAGVGVDSANAYLVSALKVTTSSFGRFTLASYELMATVQSYLFVEAASNDN